jgi:hypothetical protein
MRFLLLVLGIALGVAGTLAYAMFAPTAEVPVAHPLPANPAITITLGESFLTEIMQRTALEAPGVSVPRTQLRVELRDDTIVVHANVEVLGQPTDGTAVLRPVLRGDRLQIDVVETNLGSMPLPAFEQVLDKQINARIQSLLQGMPVTITGVNIERDKGLTIACQVDLDRLDHQRSANSQAAR